MPRHFDYALILVERLKTAQGGFLGIRTIAKEHALSPTYLEKVAQGLARAGWLEGRRGAGGGYRLARNTGKVSIESLINYFERWPKFCPVARIRK